MTSPNPLRLTVIDYEAIPNVTPEQAELGARRVAEHADDADDARLLLGIVLGIGDKPQPEPQPEPKPARAKPVPPRAPLLPCGTPAAYKRHRDAREEACEACLAAIAKARADERARRRLRNPPPPGSPRQRKQPATCSPGVRYEPVGFRVGRCGDCGQLVATHIIKDGAERMMSHPLAGVSKELAA